MQQVVKKANGMLTFIARRFEYRSRDMLLQLYRALPSVPSVLPAHGDGIGVQSMAVAGTRSLVLGELSGTLSVGGFVASLRSGAEKTTSDRTERVKVGGTSGMSRVSVVNRMATEHIASSIAEEDSIRGRIGEAESCSPPTLDDG
eukprot:g32738.t1